ncbi:PEP/pyruvate-binding domain-containing protein [Streptomyces sp. NPDC021224]|uniref:PEP/pyruvate-binding domain-containing protein n=1 Tax=unclassified Streptomyces TaxID=2593676 RepID=UPI0037A7FA28
MVRTAEHGAKAGRLAALSAAGFPVPAFTVIPADVLEGLVRACPELSAAFAHYRQGFVNKLDVLGRARRVAEGILELHVPDEVVRSVADAVARAGVAPPWIARSSGSLEDADGPDLAGAYESVPDLMDLDALMAGVRRCWASLYGPRALLRFNDSSDAVDGAVRDLSRARMSVIVQSQVDGPWSGVAFSADPTTGIDSVVVVEAAPERGGVADGARDAARALAVRTSAGTRVEQCEGGLPEELALRAAVLARRVHEWAGEPQDIEWAAGPDGSVHLVQARPAFTGRAARRPRPAAPAFRLAAVGEGDEGFPLGHCSGIAASYRTKKLGLRRLARELDIPVPAWFWLHYNRGGLDAARRAGRSVPFESPFVQLDVSTNIRALVRPVTGLPGLLTELADAHPDGQLTVHLRDAVPSELAAVTAASPDGAVTVEYVMGALQGLRSGASEASGVVLDAAGRVVRETRALQTAVERLVPEENRIARGPYGRVADALPAGLAQRLARWTRALESARPGIRPEWWIWDGRAWLADASFENDPLEPSTAVLSEGRATGTVVRVGPDDLPADLSNGYAISADAVNGAAYDLPVLARFRGARPWLPERSWIVVADRPRIELALLLPWAAGFVFETGSQLSHLAITLRAQRIPAVLQGDLTGIEDGTTVVVRDGSVSPAPAG